MFVAASRQVQIVALGGLQLLLPLTRSKDVEVQRLAVHALANLSVDRKCATGYIAWLSVHQDRRDGTTYFLRRYRCTTLVINETPKHIELSPFSRPSRPYFRNIDVVAAESPAPSSKRWRSSLPGAGCRRSHIIMLQF